MNRSNNSRQRSVFFASGWWTIVIGVIFFALFLVDYRVKFLFDYKGLDNLGGIITATTGICFSLAGLFFVLDNLQLQRETLNLQKEELRNQIHEMQLSNEHFDSQNLALLNQQYQSTFFSLLNNHTTLVTNLTFENQLGFVGLANFYNLTILYAKDLKISLKQKRFEKHSVTGQNPFYLLEMNIHSIEAILTDLVTIIQLIDNKLPEILYYNIIYNYLTVYEKYLIGLYCDCFDNDIVRYFNTHEFDFKKYYNGHPETYRLLPVNYFPYLEIRRNQRITFDFSEIEKAREFFDFDLHTRRDLFSGNLQLKNVQINVGGADYNGGQIEDFSILPEKLNPLSLEGNIFIRLSHYILPEIKKLAPAFLNLDIEFRIKYFEEMFVIKYSMSLTTSLIPHNDQSDGLNTQIRVQRTSER